MQIFSFKIFMSVKPEAPQRHLRSKKVQAKNVNFNSYNHATIKLAMYSKETSQDKLSKA